LSPLILSSLLLFSSSLPFFLPAVDQMVAAAKSQGIAVEDRDQFATEIRAALTLEGPREATIHGKKVVVVAYTIR
jgi:hypothetical protein